MKFFRIFETKNQGLFAVQFDDYHDELHRLLNEWQDILYLREFFKANEQDLITGYYSPFSIEEAVLKTREDAKTIDKLLKKIETGAKDSSYLDFHFRPLKNESFNPNKILEKNKFRLDKSWIRIYALKLTNNFYLVTGGTIKLTKNMDDRIHTKIELQKLDHCIDYLRDNGIFDEEGLKEILE